MEQILSVSNLSKEYRKKKERITALKDVSFSLETGELVGLLGPNGAGKTTTVKIICGLVYPDGGKVEVSGADPWQERAKALSKLSAVLEGNRNIYWPLTVWENLEFFAGLKGIAARKIRNRINNLIEVLNLQDKRDTTARSLSRGMQQKLALAVALVSDVPLLILDEPTLGLDVESALEIRRMLQEIVSTGNKAVLLTTHDMRLVKAVCPRVIIISKGRIVTDDRVDNLLRLFEVKAYRFNLAGKLDEAQKEELKNLGNIYVVDHSSNGMYLDINMEQPEMIYEVMDILRQKGTIIDSIEKQEPDLEEIFLEMVNRG